MDDDGKVTGQTYPITSQEAEKLADKILALEKQAKEVTANKYMDTRLLLGTSSTEPDDDGNYFDKNGK